MEVLREKRVLEPDVEEALKAAIEGYQKTYQSS